MPIYEYNCSTCDIQFDRMRPMSQADEQANCPRCGASVGRCASTFASRNSNGKISGSSGGGCASCAGGSCATCGGH